MKAAIVTAGLMLAGTIVAEGALVLSGSSYSETFDGLSSGLPAGWTVRTGATSTSPGTESTFSTLKVAWSTTTGGFRNSASADGMLGTEDGTTQSFSTDRALGVRQTGTFGDPGAAFVLELQNTLGFRDFNLSLRAQMLSVQPRSTTWTFDYRIGDSGAFTSLGTYTDPGVFGSSTVTFTSSQLSAWDNQSSAVWFRVVALSGSTGTDNRDTFGIDDFSLTFTPVPEPAEWGLGAVLALTGMYALRCWRQARLVRQDQR